MAISIIREKRTGRTDKRTQFTESTVFPLPVSYAGMLMNDLLAYGWAVMASIVSCTPGVNGLAMPFNKI